jgi:hypothetical protein
MKVIRNLVCVLGLASLCACGGGGGGIFGNNPIFNGGGGSPCYTGTSQQLARPASGAYAPNTSSIEIVANGNNNNLYSTYQSWYLIAFSNTTGQQIQGGQLNLVSDPNGPHPFGSDFYYSSQMPGTLPSGQNWSIYLTQSGTGCSGIGVGGFST